MTVDVQKGHYCAVVRSWANNGTSRLIACQKVFSVDALEQLRVDNHVSNELVFLDAGYTRRMTSTASARSITGTP